MTVSPTAWRAVLPGNNGADLFEPDITEYGYLGHSFLEHGNRRFPVVFGDPDGLWVEATHRTNNGRVFYEPNVIAMAELTFENIHAAVNHLGETDFYFGWMLGATAQPAAWSVELSADETSDYWEMPFKEYLSGSSLVHGDRRFPVEFVSPTRLGQNAHLATEGGNFMYEPNVVAVAGDFTFDAIRAAVTQLTDTGRFDRMLGYSAEQ